MTSGKYTSIYWEQNELQNAWGSEGRIYIYTDLYIFPNGVVQSITKGINNILHRINCNEFIEYLVNNHQFLYVTNTLKLSGGVQKIEPTSINDVKSTIPDDLIDDYIKGLET